MLAITKSLLVFVSSLFLITSIAFSQADPIFQLRDIYDTPIEAYVFVKSMESGKQYMYVTDSLGRFQYGEYEDPGVITISIMPQMDVIYNFFSTTLYIKADEVFEITLVRYDPELRVLEKEIVRKLHDLSDADNEIVIKELKKRIYNDLDGLFRKYSISLLEIDYFPLFPYPPPNPTSKYTFPKRVLKKGETLSYFDKKLRIVLEAVGYKNISYYKVPGGFAITAPLEQIREDGLVVSAQNRFNINLQNIEREKVGLIQYLLRLLKNKEGRYRLMVFWISDEHMFYSGVNPQQGFAASVGRGGIDELPFNEGSKEITEAHKFTVLIYEFKRSELDGEMNFLLNSGIEPDKHLEGLNLIKMIKNLFNG